MTLALRRTGIDEYAVIDDGRAVGRIRRAAERSNDVWMWHVTVLIPGSPFGHADSFEAAKAAFREAWTKFKADAGSDRLARAYETQDNANGNGKT